MNNRTRFQAVMSFQPVDRLPAIESYWWWDKTLERWYEEGLPRELTGHGEIARYLGLDMHRIFWLRPWLPEADSINNTTDYDKLVSKIYAEPTWDRTVKDFALEQSRGDVFLWLQIDGFFWFPRCLLGIDRHLYAFYDQPELIHRINSDLANYTLRLIDKLCRVCRPDLLTFAEDMAYNKGPMLSKECFDEFIAPYYHQVVPMLKNYNIIPMIDCDGNATELIGWLEEAGIEGLSPLERRAGNDIRAIRRQHPQFKILGGFDKTVMHLGETAMRQEFERILPVMRTGGYIPSVDHQTPPDVSLSNYHCYVSLLREYCEKAAVG